MRWFLGKPDRKSWDQFEKYGSLSLRDVKLLSKKIKEHLGTSAGPFFSPAEKGYSVCVNQRAGGRVCGGFLTKTMRTSRNPTTVMTGNGEVQTRREATENVKELDLFVTVVLLEEIPAVLSLGKLCEVTHAAGKPCQFCTTSVSSLVLWPLSHNVSRYRVARTIIF